MGRKKNFDEVQKKHISLYGNKKCRFSYKFNYRKIIIKTVNRKC